MQALAVLGELEDLAVIDRLALEHGTSVMKRMGEEVQPRVAPWHEFAVHPDEAVTLIVRLSGRRHCTYFLRDQRAFRLSLAQTKALLCSAEALDKNCASGPPGVSMPELSQHD